MKARFLAAVLAERDCTLAQKKGHLQDVDRDGDIDLLLLFDVTETGIDLGDTRACMIGRTLGNVGVYGCENVSTITPR